MPKVTTRETPAATTILALEEGKLLDFITGEPIKDTAKERVRQRIARALVYEHGIAVADMARDFKLRVGRRRKTLDIAIFAPGAGNQVEDLRRIVICNKEPKRTTKGAYPVRDHAQAAKEFALLHGAMATVEGCRHGLWTNGLELFFFEKLGQGEAVEFRPIGDWPIADGPRSSAGHPGLRRADPEMLRTAFRRCHNFIHGNEGMPKDATFWQFLYLIFAKMHDEKRGRDQAPRFWAGPSEAFDESGRRAIRARVLPLFDEVKREYATIFRGNEEITLSDRALAFMVSELGKYDLGRTDVDAKGAAYQEIVGTNLRGDRGQYFTPRGAIELMVEMLAPQPHERVLDPSCGTGGFLVAALNFINRQLQGEAQRDPGRGSADPARAIRERLSSWARSKLFGADFDPFLVRAAQMNIVMASEVEGQVFNMNSLEFPAGTLSGVDGARAAAGLGTMDVVMSNPPFGSDIPVTDPDILRDYELARIWEREPGGGYRDTGRMQTSVAPEVLFIERCVNWLRPGGRAGIVLPNGILGNPGDEYIRWWILRHCWVIASVDLPVEVFIVEAKVNILTSLLFIKTKTAAEIEADQRGAAPSYPVFMAVAESVGFDRRGNPRYKRLPSGEEMVEAVEVRETIRVEGQDLERRFWRRDKILDDDLPAIAAAYREFRTEHGEPGA